MDSAATIMPSGIHNFATIVPTGASNIHGAAAMSSTDAAHAHESPTAAFLRSNAAYLSGYGGGAEGSPNSN